MTAPYQYQHEDSEALAKKSDSGVWLWAGILATGTAITGLAAVGLLFLLGFL